MLGLNTAYRRRKRLKKLGKRLRDYSKLRKAWVLAGINLQASSSAIKRALFLLASFPVQI